MTPMQERPLSPTLWRTCRTLANAKRLLLMRRVLARGEATVSSLAEEADLTIPETSLMLRQLQSRGLMKARRKGSQVFYRAKPDPLVKDADTMLNALKDAIADDYENEALIRMFTGFTHPRRLVLARLIASGIHTSSLLRARGRMSKTALNRHLEKLRTHGYIERKRDNCRPAAHLAPLAERLWNLAVQGTQKSSRTF